MRANGRVIVREGERPEEVEREAGSRDEMETGLNPLFLPFFSFLCFCGKEEEGQVWLLLLLLRKQQQRKG